MVNIELGVRVLGRLGIAALVMVASTARAEADPETAPSSEPQAVGVEVTVEMAGTVPAEALAKVEAAEEEGDEPAEETETATTEGDAPAGQTEATANAEEIAAAPVADDAAESDDTNLTVGNVGINNMLGGRTTDSDRPWGVSLSLTHSLGIGTFVRNDYVAEQRDYFAQSYSLSGHYSFPVMGHDLTASLMAAASLELTEPNTNPARRFKPRDTQLGLSDAQVYKEPLTDIVVSASLGFGLPTSYESINTQRKWLTTQASVGLSREFGRLMVGYKLSAAKFFNGATRPRSRTDVARDVDDPVAASEGSYWVRQGAPNASFAVSNSVIAGYEILEHLMVGYVVGLSHTWGYPTPDDQYTSRFADPGRSRKLDMFSSSIELSYGASELVGTYLDIPVDLTAAVGMATAHSAQSSDNDSLRLPYFYNTFADNQAANNYGSFYFTLSGAY